MDKSTLLSYQPNYYKNSLVMNNFDEATANELNKINDRLSVVLKQFFIYQADISLSRYEKEFGIITNENDDINLRRSRIIAKLRGQGTATVKVIENVAKSFVNDDKVKIIEDNSNYRFIIDLYSSNVKNLYDIEKAIDEIKPAHLGYEFSITEEKTLNLQTHVRDVIYPYFMCGTFLCGTKPDIDNLGTKVTAELKANTNDKDTKQKYNMAGTFSTGGDII